MNLAHEIENSQVCGQCGDKFDNKRDLKRHHLLFHKRKKLFLSLVKGNAFHQFFL
jgi:hypothetical protein